MVNPEKAVRRRSQSHRGLPRAGGDRAAVLTARVRPKGERTLQRVPLSRDMLDQLDTLWWLRAQAQHGRTGEDAPTKEDLYDEAATAFLRKHEKRGGALYPSVPPGEEDRTMWIDSDLVSRCKALSKRDGVPMRLLMRLVFSEFLSSAVQPGWMDFRAAVGAVAEKLLKKQLKSVPASLSRLARQGARNSGD